MIYIYIYVLFTLYIYIYIYTCVWCIRHYAIMKANYNHSLYYSMHCLRCAMVTPPSVPIVKTRRAKPPLVSEAPSLKSVTDGNIKLGLVYNEDISKSA